MDETTTRTRADYVVVARDTLAGETAVLSFDNGVERLRLRSDDRLDALLDARFGEPWPTVRVGEGQMHVEYPLGARLLRRVQHSTMRLSTAVSWAIEVHGGAAHLEADLTGLRLLRLSFSSGVARSRVVLGDPVGEQVITMNAAKNLRIERPAHVPVRIELAKGATNITLDQRWYGAVGRGLADQTPGYETAEHRYLVKASGGVAGVQVGGHGAR